MQPGSIGWVDLTVPDAPRARDFYAEVVGWTPAPVDMGDYDDFNMLAPETGDPVAGICHARGRNAELPPVWMVYFVVEDLDASVAACERLGGAVVSAPQGTGGSSRYAVVRDPGGAVCALVESAD